VHFPTLRCWLLQKPNNLPTYLPMSLEPWVHAHTLIFKCVLFSFEQYFQYTDYISTLKEFEHECAIKGRSLPGGAANENESGNEDDHLEEMKVSSIQCNSQRKEVYYKLLPRTSHIPSLTNFSSRFVCAYFTIFIESFPHLLSPW
jgi:hypothetical protein